MSDVDYCVVGAGFAGLTAALRIKQSGHSVAVLEARDRIGGRTFTEVRDDSNYIEVGIFLERFFQAHSEVTIVFDNECL